MSSKTFRGAVAEVVAAGNCSGCGGCAALDGSLSMERSAAGYNRPIPVAIAAIPILSNATYHEFRAVCPGVGVSAQRPTGSQRHGILGPHTGSWQAWASDEKIRFAGSSGGALTALAIWMLDSPEFDLVVTAQADTKNVQNTTVQVARASGEVKAAAGSRYAPVSIAAEPLAHSARSVVLGKPCEVSSIRARNRESGKGLEPPFLLSFFCAGVPSQDATDRLVDSNFNEDGLPLRSLRYRGNGWPGQLEACGKDGSRFSMNYDESWGRHLGPTMQWRCKVCADGVGESADIVAGDFWHTDSRGYPVFSDQPGRSVLIARTERGLAAVLGAAEDGVLILEPIDLDEVAKVQPLQDSRRRTLVGRLLGARMTGRPVPRYHGFGLTWLGCTSPVKTVRTMLGTIRRSWGWRRDERMGGIETSIGRTPSASKIWANLSLRRSRS